MGVSRTEHYTIQDSEVDGRIYSTDSEVDALHGSYDQDYNTIPSYDQFLNQRTEGGERLVGRTSSFYASYNILCTVVGTGLLQLPYGLNESGWIGVFLLIGMCAIATYTAITLIKCMNPPSGKKLYTYSEIGREAFGVYGGVIVDGMLHATLIGVGTIYLILAGENLSTLLNEIPWKAAGASANYVISAVDINPHLCIIIVACVMWLHVWLGTLHEVGFMSAFNVCVAIFLALVVIGEILFNMPTDRGDHNVINKSYYGLSLAGAWVSFAFSYGAHAVLPTVYETMKKPKQFNAMITLTFLAILCFYIPMACVGYYAYGDGTMTPIYNNLCDGTSCTYGEQLGKWFAILAVTVHVMLSFAIILNPTELALERITGVDKKPNPQRKLIGVTLRTFLVIFCVIIAELIPDFGDFLNLVSAVTNTSTSFVLPCLFHLRLFWPRLKGNYFAIGIDVGIIVIATLAGIFGAFFSSMAILCHVFGVQIVSAESGCENLFASFPPWKNSS